MTKEVNVIDGRVNSVVPLENTYQLIIEIDKIRWNGGTENTEMVKKSKDWKEFEDRFYKQLAMISLGRVRIEYLDK
jgi:hypothetical protein